MRSLSSLCLIKSAITGQRVSPENRFATANRALQKSRIQRADWQGSADKPEGCALPDADQRVSSPASVVVRVPGHQPRYSSPARTAPPEHGLANPSKVRTQIFWRDRETPRLLRRPRPNT